jgi:hypothetical protein
MQPVPHGHCPLSAGPCLTQRPCGCDFSPVRVRPAGQRNNAASEQPGASVRHCFVDPTGHGWMLQLSWLHVRIFCSAAGEVYQYYPSPRVYVGCSPTLPMLCGLLAANVPVDDLVLSEVSRMRDFRTALDADYTRRRTIESWLGVAQIEANQDGYITPDGDNVYAT